MYDKILKRARYAIHQLHYVMTLHAEEEMNEDELSILDIENCVLSGKKER